MLHHPDSMDYLTALLAGKGKRRANSVRFEDAELTSHGKEHETSVPKFG
jgi:hypothetical protein